MLLACTVRRLSCSQKLDERRLYFRAIPPSRQCSSHGSLIAYRCFPHRMMCRGHVQHCMSLTSSQTGNASATAAARAPLNLAFHDAQSHGVKAGAASIHRSCTCRDGHAWCTEARAIRAPNILNLTCLVYSFVFCKL